MEYTEGTKSKEVALMEKLTNFVKTRKPLSFKTSQVLYGVSVALTFIVAGRLGNIA